MAASNFFWLSAVNLQAAISASYAAISAAKAALCSLHNLRDGKLHLPKGIVDGRNRKLICAGSLIFSTSGVPD